MKGCRNKLLSISTQHAICLSHANTWNGLCIIYDRRVYCIKPFHHPARLFAFTLATMNQFRRFLVRTRVKHPRLFPSSVSVNLLSSRIYFAVRLRHTGRLPRSTFECNCRYCARDAFIDKLDEEGKWRYLFFNSYKAQKRIILNNFSAVIFLTKFNDKSIYKFLVLTKNLKISITTKNKSIDARETPRDYERMMRDVKIGHV